MKEIRGPLDELLKNGIKFKWESMHQESFDKLKSILSSDLVLTHFDPNKEIILATDASKDGMGAALMHRFKDGSLHPIMHFAATFNTAEKNYSQIEKEARALIFGLKRSHFYIAGRRITAHVDHKPLLAIFGSKAGIPVYTANRLQRWALIVMAYDVKFVFIGTNSFGYADVVSRLMSKQTKSDEDIVIANVQEHESDEEMLSYAIQSAQNLPITFKEIEDNTSSCPVLQEVIKLVKTDRWPQAMKQVRNLGVAAYYQCRNDLKIAHNCLFRGEQIIIPTNLRPQIITELHKGHPGVCRMKLLAADKVYWPNITQNIEETVKNCETCAKVAKAPIKCTLKPWPMPTAPWTRVHLDYAGPINGFYFLVIVDAYSKWPEIIKTTTTTGTKTVEIFADVLARQGLCEVCVTDNGPQFVCQTFEEFCRSQGIKHLSTAFYSPQSNGQAERFVDLLKLGLQKAEGNLDQKLREFLLTYRYTPSYNLGRKSPFQLMTGRQMRTKLDLLKPGIATDWKKDEKMEERFNSHHGAKWKEFAVNDEIFYQLKSKLDQWKWVPGIVKSRIGAVVYVLDIVTPTGHRTVKAHANQIKRRHLKNEIIELFDLPDSHDNHHIGPIGDVQPTIVPVQNYQASDNSDQESSSDDDQVNNQEQDHQTEQEQRYPRRENRGVTTKFQDYVTY